VRFLVGLLGGAIAGLLTIAVFCAAAGHNATHALAAISALITDNSSPGPVIGALLLIGLCSGLGSIFTTGVCGGMATGPAIGVGLAYGLLIWLFIVILLLPTLASGFTISVRSSTIAWSSFLFGGLMGVWVIVAAHIWPSMATRCQGPSEGTEGIDEEG
jgi:hypothetical protein